MALPSQTEVFLCDAPYGASFIESLALFHSPSRASLAHVVPAATLRVRANDLWVFPGRPVADVSSLRRCDVIPGRQTPRTRRRMPVILVERAVLDGPSRDALQPVELASVDTRLLLLVEVPTAPRGYQNIGVITIDHGVKHEGVAENSGEHRTRAYFPATDIASTGKVAANDG